MKITTGKGIELDNGRKVEVFPIEESKEGPGFLLQFTRHDGDKETVTRVVISTDAALAVGALILGFQSAQTELALAVPDSCIVVESHPIPPIIQRSIEDSLRIAREKGGGDDQG